MPTDTPPGLDLRLSPEELEATRDHVVGFIQERVDDAGAEGTVLGLSGGIDSTLVAHLAVEALGADAVHGLVMPGEVSREDNMSDAERVAMSLNMPYDVAPIEPIVDALLEVAPGGGDADEAEDPHRTAVGNLRARSRMLVNYFVANVEGGLVLGTGNRTEALVGYFTKYGDGAVDCLPIGDLYKGQVRQLAAHLSVDERIIEKPPTAGLWAGQTDEGELAVAYETLDAVLALAVDGPFSVSATAAHLKGVEEADVERVLAMHHASDHKRLPPPSPGPAV